MSLAEPRQTESLRKGEAHPVWHAVSSQECLMRVGGNADGLSASEATSRLERDGPNRLRETASRSVWLRLLDQFNDPLIYVLLVTSLVTSLVTTAIEHYVDSAVILGVVVINAVVGFLQESKAERAIASLGKMLSPIATVVRNGETIEVPAEELVVGDIVSLGSGSKVPADLRLIMTRSLMIDEAPLTGESVPSEKSSESAGEHASVGDQHSMAFASTLVTTGTAIGVVVATADESEIDRDVDGRHRVGGLGDP